MKINKNFANLKENKTSTNLKTEFSIKNLKLRREYEFRYRKESITQYRSEPSKKAYFLSLCCFIIWSVLINVYDAYCAIPTEVSCGVSYIGQTKTCSFSVPNGNYTLSISQPYQNVFSLPKTNIVGDKITLNFTPTSQDVFFAVVEINNNSTSEKKNVFIKGEGFSSDKIVVRNQQNLGYVFREDNPKIDFEVQNFTELSTIYIKSSYSCEISYVIPKDKTRCSTTLNYSGQKSGSFSKVFDLELLIDGYEQSITFYVSGVWAYPNVSFEKSLNFPGVLVGRSHTKFARISNQGNYPLVISGAIDNPPFYLGKFPVYVQSDFFLPITFTPNSAGYFSRSVTLITNIGYLVIDLEGYGVSNPFPTLFSESITVDFGILIPKETRVRTIEISNVGAENLVIRNIYIPPKNPFSLHQDVDFPLVLLPAQSVEVPLYFSPQAEGDFSSYLEIETNDVERVRFRINLFGRAYIPDISATKSIDFGYVRVGWRKRKDIIISNEKPFPFVISNIYFGKKDGFSYEQSYSFPLLLKYQETISFPVIFSPNDLTRYEAQITVVALLPQSSSYSFESKQNISPKFIQINISGYGGYPRMNVKDEINLGTIWSDESKYEIFPIENTGDTDLEVKLNIQSDVFTISAYDIVVSPGETFPLRLSFSPQGKSGNFSAYLYLFSNDPEIPKKTVRVIATSKSPDVVLEGKGCKSFSSSFIVFIGLILFMLKLVSVYKLKLVISFFLIQAVFIDEALSLNIIFSPKSDGRLFFTREPNFFTKETVSFSNVFYISFGQLQRNIYKEERIVQSFDLIRSSLISEFSASYSISDDSVLYASIPIGYFSGDLRGLGVSDFFVGGKMMLYEAQNVSFFSELFAGVPVGSEKFYINSSPFSLGIIGGMKLDNFISNIGAIYGGRDIPLRSLLSGGASIQITNKIFNGYDAYILFPLAIKRGFVSSEISTSVGFSIDEFIGKFGISKGLIGGFGSSEFRIFFSATANINPKVNPSIKYFQASGIILDAFGNKVSGCIVQIKDIMVSKVSKDGNFSFELPRGTYEVQVMCEGFEISKGYVSNVNPNIKINVERIQPTLITYSTDRTGIPIERDIKVRIDESEFDIQTYYVVLRGSKNIRIQSGSFSRDLYISKPEFVWLRIDPREAVKSEQIGHDDKSVADTVEEGKVETKENLFGDVRTKENLDQEKFEQKKSDEERKTGEIKKNVPQEHTLAKEIKEVDREDIIRERATQIFRQKLYDIYTEKDDVVVRVTISGFALNSASLPSHAQRQLQELADFVSKNIDKIREILIEGHTDDIGSESWNLELSYSRANSVRKYLFEKGLLIPIKIVGYSSMFPLKKSDDPQVKSVNRRAEIKIFMK